MHAVYRDDARQPPKGEGDEGEEEGEGDDAERARPRLPIFLRNTLFALVAFFFTAFLFNLPPSVPFLSPFHFAPVICL